MHVIFGNASPDSSEIKYLAVWEMSIWFFFLFCLTTNHLRFYGTLNASRKNSCILPTRDTTPQTNKSNRKLISHCDFDCKIAQQNNTKRRLDDLSSMRCVCEISNAKLCNVFVSVAYYRCLRWKIKYNHQVVF